MPGSGDLAVNKIPALVEPTFRWGFKSTTRGKCTAHTAQCETMMVPRRQSAEWKQDAQYHRVKLQTKLSRNLTCLPEEVRSLSKDRKEMKELVME